MAEWVNRGVVQEPRNGTTSHTFAFGFTATAGRLLVVIGYGAVTFTTPGGWTLRQSAVNNGGLYVWTKTAAGGETSFTTTHNGSNYPAALVAYEFPAGSAWVSSVTASGVGLGGANPNLTGLTGTNQLFGVVGSANAGPTPETTTWSGTGSPVEDVDVSTAASGTDGYTFSVSHIANSTATSFQPTGAVTGGAGKEAITLAVSTPAAGFAVSGTVAATSSVALSVGEASPVSGVVAASTAVSGAVAVRRPVAGVVAATSGLSAAVVVNRPVSGTVATVSGATLTANEQRSVAGQVAAASSVSLDVAVISGGFAVSGTAQATSSVALTIGRRVPVSGVTTAATSSSLTTTLRAPIAGTVAATSTASLTVRSTADVVRDITPVVVGVDGHPAHITGTHAHPASATTLTGHPGRIVRMEI